MQGRHLTGPHGRRSTNGRQACGSSGVGVRFLPVDDVRDVNVSLGMADCGQHGIEQLRSVADEWLAGDVLIAAGTQARWPIREPNGGEFESFWPYLIPGGIKFTEGPTIPGRTGADAASIPISCVGIEIRLTKKRPTGQRAESMALCEDGQFIPRGAVYVHNQ